MVSWLELVYDYGLAILGMDVLLHLLYVRHHLYVAAVDIYLNFISFLLAHILDISWTYMFLVIPLYLRIPL